MDIKEALQKFVEEKEECVVYTSNGTMIIARIIEVGDGFMRLDEKDSESIVNLENVLRVRSYPKNEKGKKKSIFT